MAERLKGISGGMYSGKSEELLRRVNRAEIAGRNVLLVKPAVDVRGGEDYVSSRTGAKHSAIAVCESKEILDYVSSNTQIVAVDEIQFMDSQIVTVIKILLDQDIEVHFAGLPLDFRGESFGSMPDLLALADDLMRLTAICTYENGKICGKDATRTQRFVDCLPASYYDHVVEIEGESRSITYAARCPEHHFVLDKPKNVLK